MKYTQSMTRGPVWKKLNNPVRTTERIVTLRGLFARRNYSACLDLPFTGRAPQAHRPIEIACQTKRSAVNPRTPRPVNSGTRRRGSDSDLSSASA